MDCGEVVCEEGNIFDVVLGEELRSHFFERGDRPILEEDLGCVEDHPRVVSGVVT